MHRLGWATLVTLSLCAPAAGASDYAYRSVMPDGTVRYGDAPEWGARWVKKLPSPPRSTGAFVITPAERSRRLRAEPEGVRVVLSPPGRERPAAAQQGQLQAPTELPKRGGYY